MTILRKAEHTALARVTLHGSVIDLGGDKRSEYAEFIKGTYTLTRVDISAAAMPDIIADLEKPIPVESATYDGALLMNVLEHIFEYRQLLGECARVLRPGGNIVIVVPYLFPYHASPDDFHRFSASALQRALAAAGFSDIHIEALGTGVFAARYSLIERLLPAPLRFLSRICVPLSAFLDGAFTALARATGKKYLPSDYALGFVATATKL